LKLSEEESRSRAGKIQKRRTLLIVALAVLVVVVGAAVGYCLLVPANTFIIFRRTGGGTVSFSRQGIEFQGPPDRYIAGGFDHIESYVTRLMAPSRKKRFVGIFTPAGDRGFGLYAGDGKIEAQLSVQWRQEPQREAAIRDFFGTLGIQPTGDYLSGNGGVPDATRALTFPLTGNASEVAALTKRILQELCGVSSTEPLDIRYTE
jgi:hypothetical protein